MKLNNLNWKQIKVGNVFSFKKVIDDELIDHFAELVGDYNPLHIDTAYAKKMVLGADWPMVYWWEVYFQPWWACFARASGLYICHRV